MPTDWPNLPGMIRALLLAAAATAAVVGIALPPPASASGPYPNCTAAHQDGRYNIPRGDPDYRAALDRDNDGFACGG